MFFGEEKEPVYSIQVGGDVVVGHPDTLVAEQWFGEFALSQLMNEVEFNAFALEIDIGIARETLRDIAIINQTEIKIPRSGDLLTKFDGPNYRRRPK